MSSLGAGNGEAADIAIIGGGLAGLSLACRLVDPAFEHLRVVVLEPRTSYSGDRTWSYWRLFDHPFQHLADRSWQRWRVASNQAASIQTSCRHPYERLPSERLYAAAVQRLERAPHVELRLGCRVDEVASLAGAGVRVCGPWGALEVDLAFDSRPPDTRDGALVQHFRGWEVEAAGAVFEPDTVTLMDFRVAQDGPQEEGMHFAYVLPSSSRVALVEDTWISPAPIDPPDYDEHLRRYLKSHLRVGEFRILRSETGRIPMDPRLRRPRQRSRIVPLGTRGGLVRAATGYAFLQIQRDCDALAKKLRRRSGSWRRGLVPPRPLPALTRWMDSVFLAVLERRPEGAPELFRALTEGCSAGSLVRFLGGRGSLRDHLAVMAALPARPFLSQALFGDRLRAV